MTQKMSSTPTGTGGKKGGGFLRALGDLCILGLLLTAAGAGGYFWGLHQHLAPIETVGPGTPGTSTLPPPKSESSSAKTESKDSKESGESGTSKATKPTASSESSESSGSDDQASEKHTANKYWFTSSGADYVGYSITVKVNGNAVDNFFGPGKIVDVTSLVKNGENTVVCDAKQLGDQYNKHAG